jgi:ABC-type sugar transport system permease subunit
MSSKYSEPTFIKSKVSKAVTLDRYVPYLFVLPALIVLSIFLITPVLMAVGYSFTHFNMLRPNRITFIGLDNYIKLFSDPVFYKTLRNTVYYASIIVPLQCTFALGLALLINNRVPHISLFRIAYFSPVLLSMTVVSILWTFIYNPNPGQGFLNTILNNLNLPTSTFLTNTSTALNSIIIMSIWQGVGYQMMIFLAGLQGVPVELYEAAKIDGVNSVQRLRYITLPCLHNVTVFVVLMMTMSAMKMFTQAFIMTAGGPDNSTRTMVYYIYQQGMQYHNVGYANSLSFIYFLLVVTMSFTIRRFIGKE